MTEIVINGEVLSFQCPHCFLDIHVVKNELNCCIFRHGVYKKTYKQVDPHLKKEMCDELVKKDLVIGCCKPFEVIKKGDKLFVQVCEYK